MDYLITNATAIMQLCFGLGFLVLVGFAVRSLLILTSILKKLDDLSDIFIEYVQKPLRIFMHVHRVVKDFSKMFGK